jgi:hypothetical protein
MTHAIVTTVSQAVFEGDIERAENALVALAEQEGDLALALIIEDMPPKDLVAILREHDASKGSIVGELISPRQFLAAVSMEAQYREQGHESLRGIINGVVFRDEEATAEFIEVLGSTEAGVRALVDYFGDRHAEVEYFFRNGTFSELEGTDFSDIPASDDDVSYGELDGGNAPEVVRLSEVRDSDWRQLAWHLRVEYYEIFREVLEILRRQHRAAQQAALAPKPAPLARVDGDDEDDDEDDVL